MLGARGRAHVAVRKRELIGTDAWGLRGPTARHGTARAWPIGCVLDSDLRRTWLCGLHPEPAPRRISDCLRRTLRAFTLKP
jgi:hypothetical protein